MNLTFFRTGGVAGRLRHQHYRPQWHCQLAAAAARPLDQQPDLPAVCQKILYRAVEERQKNKSG